MNNAQRIRLLLAEDEWLIVDRIERALSGSRYRIAAKAANLHDALRLIDTKEFDAAILDGNLDGDRTWALAEKLRCTGTPCLLLTAYARANCPPSAGRTCVLAKPFSAVALLSALDLLITGQTELI
jgi:CheY-like chemotaxis protein